MAPACVRVQGLGPGDGPGQFVRVIADHARDPVGDHLRDRAAAQGDDGRATDHRLDHHDAERLLPLDREQQATGARQQLSLADRVGLAEHVVVVGEQRPHAVLEVLLFRGLTAFAGQYQRDAGLVRGPQRQVRTLVRRIPAQKQCVVMLFGLERPLVDAQRIVYAANPIQLRSQLPLTVADGHQADVAAELAVVGMQVVVDRAVHGDHRGHAQPLVDRGVHRPGKGVVVHDVDAVLFGDPGDGAAHLQRVHDLGVGLAQPLGHGPVPQRDEPGRRARFAGAEQGDLVSAGHQHVGEIGHDGLHAAVPVRRDVEIRRGDEHDPQRSAGFRDIGRQHEISAAH